MAEIEATTPSEVEAFLQKHKYAVVDCYATWCGPCVRIAPYVHKKCQEKAVPLIKINVDNAPELTNLYGIQAMPTFLVLQGNHKNKVFSKTGGSEGIVNEVIEQALKHK